MAHPPLIYSDFSGGVNLAAAPYLLGENQARDALNMHADVATGQGKKRHGIVELADLGLSLGLTGPLHSLAAVSLTEELLVGAGPAGANDALVVIDSAGGATNITGTTTPTLDTRWSFAQADVTSGSVGPIFAMNGVDTPQFWDGTGSFQDWVADVGVLPPTGNHLIYAGARLWCLEQGVPGRVRYSDITGTSPDTGNWDADAFVDLDPADGDDGTAIGRYGPYLFVFKAGKVYVITDLVTGANRVLSARMGTISPRSVVETDIGLIFWDIQHGVYSTDGSTMKQLSKNIDPMLAQAARFPDFVKQANASYVDNSYYLTISTDGNTMNRTVEYDTQAEAWWIHSCAANDWALLDPLNDPTVYAADANRPSVSKMFVPNTFADYGVPYDGGAHITGGHYVLVWFGRRALPSPHYQKRVRQVRIDGSGNWKLGYAINFNDDFTYEDGEVWDTTEPDAMLFAPSTPDGHIFAPSVDTGDLFAPTSVAVTDRRYYTLGVARAWSFKMLNEDAGDFQLFSLFINSEGRAD